MCCCYALYLRVLTLWQITYPQIMVKTKIQARAADAEEAEEEGEEKPKPKPKPKNTKATGKVTNASDLKGKGKAVKIPDDDDEDMEAVILSFSKDVKGKGKALDEFPGRGRRLDDANSVSTPSLSGSGKSTPVINLRKTRRKGRTLEFSGTVRPKRESKLGLYSGF